MCILRLRGRWPLAALISFLILLWSPLAALGQASASVALAWDPSADPGVVGYYLYYGGSSRAYTNRVSVGNTTNATISGLIPGGTYYFTATAFNAAGLESDYSNEATYTVPASAVPPTITSQPASQTVTSGSSVTLSVVATGTAPFTYQWKKDGVNIPGANTSSLALNSVSTANAGSYTVVVSNSAGSATSSAAILTVNTLVAAPVITTQPGSQTVNAGNNVTFSVSAAGTAPFTYQWKKDGVSIPGANTASLSLNSVNTASAGSYTVVVSNSAGSATSSAAILTVNELVTDPAITTQPASQTVSAGSSVTFTVVASGTAPLTYQWKKNGVAIPNANTASLALTSVTSADAGSYSVVVSNSAGSATSSAAVLTVNALASGPVISSQPVSQTVIAGDSVTFSVTVTGTAPFSYQWKKAGAVIPRATGSSFSLNNVQASNAGTYWVTVSNPSGSVTSASATLTVQPAPTADFAAGTYSGLFSDPQGVSTLSSGSFTLKVSATGKFSAKLVRGKQRSSLSGQFDAKGNVQRTLLVPNQQPVTVSLLLSPDDPEHLTGTVSDGTFHAKLLADRAGFDGVAKIAPQSGRYTLVINGNEDASVAPPRGHSIGAVTVNGAGAIRLTASLADGTKISQSVPLSGNGDWPLFASLYSGSGSIMSWAKFDSSNSGGIGGDIVWIKPAVPRAKLYPAGFSFTTAMRGAPYKPGAKALILTTAKLTLADGNLPAQIVNRIVLAPGNRVTNLGDNKLSLKFSPSTGLFTGRVTDPTTSKPIPFSGAVLQDENAGFGWFSGLNAQSGTVTITED
jgi:hypothetical protein